MRPKRLPSPLKTFIGIVTLLFAGNAYAANWYVRPSSAGSNTGADWNNAWSLSSINWGSVHGGDTVWLAGGNYPQGLATGGSGTAGNPITINRVQSTDSVPTSAAGWSGSFDSTVSFPSGIDVPSGSYVTINGRVSLGILISIPLSGGNGISGAESGSIDHISFYNIGMVGPYASTSNSSGGAGISGINIAPSNNLVTNMLVHNCSIRGIGEALRASNWSNVIIENCYIADTANDGQQHEDVMYSYPSTNVTFRYNLINNSPNDGVFFEYGGATNFSFYGNVYYNSELSFLTTKAPGNYGPLLIYNNVFMCPTTSNNAGWLTGNGSTISSGTRVYNNIFYNVTNSVGGGTSDYNAYNYTSLAGYSWPSGESHSITFSGNPFVNIPADSQPVGSVGDFHLTAAMQALFQNGIALTADGFINKDIDGNTRGSGGHWYIGAYQYGSGQQPTPQPPGNLRITANP